MGSDEIFKKKKAQRIKRESGNRKISPSYLIVIEGAKTEPYYFKKLIEKISVQGSRIELPYVKIEGKGLLLQD